MKPDKPDPQYEPGPHRSDDAPAMRGGTAPADLTLGGGASVVTWRRARARARCACGGLLDLDCDDTPEKVTGKNRLRVGCPCDACGALTYLTPKEMIDIARTVGQTSAAGMMAAMVTRARRLNAQAHDAMNAGPGASEHTARLSNAAATLEVSVLRAAGLLSDKVEVEHRFAGDETLEIEARERARKMLEDDLRARGFAIIGGEIVAVKEAEVVEGNGKP